MVIIGTILDLDLVETTIVTSLLGLVIGYLWSNFTRAGESRLRRMKEEKNIESLQTKVLKVILRSQLVQMHGQLMKFGDVDETQLMTWVTMYESYIEICEATNDRNGIIERYNVEVMNLPQYCHFDHKEGEKKIHG